MAKIVTVLLFMISSPLFGQDSLFNRMKIDFDIGFGTYYQFSSYQKTNFSEAKIPLLLSPRRKDEPELRDQWGLNNNFVTDNPLFHGAYFFDAGVQIAVAKGLQATVMITAEQRGFSDGRFSKNTINIFPYFNIIYQRRFGNFSYSLQAGDFYNSKLYEGLTYYNIQTSQSWIFKVKYKNFYIKQYGVADLTRNIGLGIDDLYDYSLGLEGLTFSQQDSLQLNVRLGYSDNTGAFNPQVLNYAANLTYRNRLVGYAQLSTRNITGSNSAFLLGISIENKKASRLEMQAQVEFRKYGAAFNQGFINNVYYRNPNESASFTNSIDNVFFPLITFERPFSQWAVFTEYQNRNVSGFALQGKWHYRLFGKTYVKFEHDLNWIFTENQPSFLYPFYAFGIGAKPKSEIELFFELTNKVLNLDKHYPTLYSATSSYFLIHVFKPIKFRKQNDQQHRL